MEIKEKCFEDKLKTLVNSFADKVVNANSILKAECLRFVSGVSIETRFNLFPETTSLIKREIERSMFFEAHNIVLIILGIFGYEQEGFNTVELDRISFVRKNKNNE